MVVLPGRGAVSVENVKVFAGEKLAAIHARLNGSKPTEDSDLFDVADQRDDVEPFEFSVDSVEATNQMLEEELKGLREAEHSLTVNDKGGNLLIAIVDQFAFVCCRVCTGDRRRTMAAVRRTIATVMVVMVVVTVTAPVMMMTTSVRMVSTVKGTFGAL